ncbi:MAG TPA: hypothetical protein VM689_03950 [Aliidongia sp.]|nr:hypothetical protein [Aliidongia sp.]
MRYLSGVAALLPLAATIAWADPAPDAPPATLRDAVTLFGQDFNVKIVGINRLGTEAPDWPSQALPPADTLYQLLKHYSYAVILQPSDEATRSRLPAQLFIAGENKNADSSTTIAGAPAADPAPHSATAAADLAVWGRQPSSVVRNLNSLAISAAPRPQSDVGDGATAQRTPAPQPLAAMENPAQSAAAMAALTRSAQSSLNALVTGLRNACPNPKGC